MANPGNPQAQQKKRKSRAKGRTSAEQFSTAQRRVQEAREAGTTELDLEDLPKLASLPPEIAGLTDLQRLDLTNTQVSDLAPLAGLTALRNLDLSETQVNDLTPLAGLTALQNLDLSRAQVRDLAPLAAHTTLQDEAASQNAMRRSAAVGLSYAHTPVAQGPPFDQLVQLDEPARTVETINEVRRQQGLPVQIPEGYEQPQDLPASTPDNNLPSEPIPPSQPLPTPGPATRFAAVGGRIDIVPPEAWKDQKGQAAAYHARACKLAVALAERLSKTDAVPDVAASVAALGDVLGDNVESVQPDQLRLASRSIAARARAYGHPTAQWEISPDSVSAIFELADLLVDLQGFAKTDIEANERAIRQLDLSPNRAAAAKTALDEITSAIEAIPEVVTERVETTFATAASLSRTSIEDRCRKRAHPTDGEPRTLGRPQYRGICRRKAARWSRAQTREARETQKAFTEANGARATARVG
jgi:hypothetical protein